MQTSPFRFLPIFLVILAIGGAFTLAAQRQIAKNKLNDLLSKAKAKLSLNLPGPTPFIPVKQFPNDSISPSVIPSVSPTPTPRSPKDEDPSEASAKEDTLTKETKKTESKTVANAKTGTETVCTPVYGMANTCAEHAVVDTGLETDLFPGFAVMSYLGGLIAFVKAKRTRGVPLSGAKKQA